MSFAAGELLLGKLRVTRELGQGGMGQVFEVVHELTQHRRALKVLHPKLKTRDDVVQRFLREASAAGRIGNRHIAETFDAGFLADGSAYLLMELLHGCPLSAHLRAAGRLEPEEAAAIALQCCEALQAAHEARIVHRDVKPDNLFLVETSPVFLKVLDFGIAHFETSDTQPGHILGTPLYMSPEQFQGTAIDARTDLYALGVVLYEMLAGTLPWQSASLGVLAQRVTEGRLPSLSATRPELPPALCALVDRCMAVDPAARFGDALELRAALEPFAGERPRPLAPVGGDTLIRHVGDPTFVRPVAARLFAVPRPTDRFVGRAAERARIERDLADGVRLMVVVGPAGAGKTRLVVETLWGLRETSAAFVDASDVIDVDSLCTTVARALAIPVGDARIDLGVAVGAALAERPDFILALDNLEQALPNVEPLITRWLAAAPRLTLLITSRLRLSSAEATHHEVGPLDEAVELLIERVRALRGSFGPGPDDLAALTSIATEADSLPLAIELAASRLLILTPAQLRERIQDNVTHVLRRSGGVDRRSTLRSAIDSSWKILKPQEQLALAQLSVFHGGSTLSSAERVLELPAGVSALEITESLVAHSLLRVTSTDGAEPRLSLLNTVHEYARHELARGDPDFGERVRLSHAREYALLAQLVRNPDVPPDSAAVISVLQREQRNLAAALDWSARSGGLEQRGLAALLAIALDPLLEIRGNYEKRVAMLERLSTRLDGLPPEIEEELKLVHVAALLTRDRLADARARMNGLAEPTDPYRSARWFTIRGRLASRRGESDEAISCMDHALARARTWKSRWYAGRALSLQGAIANANDPVRAQQILREAMVELAASNDRRTEGLVKGNLGSTLSDLGEVMAARSLLLDALRIHVELGNRRSAGFTLTNLGILSLDEGAIAEAESFLHESLSAHREVSGHKALGTSLARLAACALLRGEHVAARSFASEAANASSAGEDTPGHASALAWLSFVACAEGRIAEAEELVAKASVLLPRNAPTHASALVVLAKAGPAAAAGQFGDARELMRGFLVPQAGQASLASKSDEIRLGLRCAATVVRQIEATRFAPQ